MDVLVDLIARLAAARNSPPVAVNLRAPANRDVVDFEQDIRERLSRIGLPDVAISAVPGTGAAEIISVEYARRRGA